MIVAETNALYENIFGRVGEQLSVKAYINWYSRRHGGGNGAGVLRNEQHQTFSYFLDWNHEVFTCLSK